MVSAHENPPKSTPSRAHAWHRRILGTKQATTVIDCDSCAFSLILMHLSDHTSVCASIHKPLTLRLASAHGYPPKTTPPRDHAWHRRIVGTKQATTVIDCDSCACSLILMHLSNHASLCTSIHKPLQLSGWYRLMRIHQNRRHREPMRGTAESWAQSMPPPSLIVIVAFVA